MEALVTLTYSGSLLHKPTCQSSRQWRGLHLKEEPLGGFTDDVQCLLRCRLHPIGTYWVSQCCGTGKIVFPAQGKVKHKKPASRADGASRHVEGRFGLQVALDATYRVPNPIRSHSRLTSECSASCRTACAHTRPASPRKGPTRLGHPTHLRLTVGCLLKSP